MRRLVALGAMGVARGVVDVSIVRLHAGRCVVGHVGHDGHCAVRIAEWTAAAATHWAESFCVLVVAGAAASHRCGVTGYTRVALR